MMRNPLVYGVTYDEKRNDPLLEARSCVNRCRCVNVLRAQRRRQDIIIGAAKTLDSVKMARCVGRGMSVRGSNIRR